MRAMKLFYIFFSCICFCACAALPNKKNKEPLRAYPVFLQGGQTSAAFKFKVKISGGNEYNTVLIFSKTGGNSAKIKMLADFATVLIDADFDGKNLTYNYAIGDIFDKHALEFLGDIIKILLSPQEDFINASNLPDEQLQTNYRAGGFMNRYYFKKAENTPYKLEQINIIVRKTVLFGNYKIYNGAFLPSLIICTDGHNAVKTELSLISVK
jgi:hypothetical protein